MTSKNILDAILTYVTDSTQVLDLAENKHNRLHAMGEPLEEYIKDIFAGVLAMPTEQKIQRISEVFSYGGGKNNPPDAIIKNGDAIEVKKVESTGSIPLNSSYPQAKLYRTDSRISNECKAIEGGNWEEKDIIYIVGNIQNQSISSLVFVYGSIYCASKEHYKAVFNIIKGDINSIELTLEETNGLAYINNVDPLGNTYFQAKSIWSIEHPLIVFKYLFPNEDASPFSLVAIIPSAKYNTFENRTDFESTAQHIIGLNIEDKKVKNPNNTAELIDVKLITYSPQAN